MIATSAKYLNTVFESLPYLGDVLGVGEIVDINGIKTPAYWHNNELQHINFDSHNALVFLLKNGEVTRNTKENEYIANQEHIEETYPFKAIFYKKDTENINCSSIFDGIISGIKKNLSGRKKDFRTAINAESVVIEVPKTNFDKLEVWGNIFTGEAIPKETDLIASIDIEVKITGNEQCFIGEPCEANDFNFDLSSTSFCEAVISCVGSIEKTELNGNGTTAYQVDELIGKEILLLFTDGRERKLSDYSFSSNTGTITFISAIQTAQIIKILYK